jgi:hypothetical protein
LRWSETKPRLLAAAFDILAKALPIKPQLARVPRMSDFAHWGYAIAEAAGGRVETPTGAMSAADFRAHADLPPQLKSS